MLLASFFPLVMHDLVVLGVDRVRPRHATESAAVGALGGFLHGGGLRR